LVGHWDKITMRVAPEETAAAPIETEAAEQKHIPSGERFHGCVSHTRPNFGNLPQFRIF
jgi:hypothetical protein